MTAESEIYAIRLGYGLSPLHAPAESTAAYLDSVARAGPEPGGISRETLKEMDKKHVASRRLERDGDENAGERRKQLQRDMGKISRDLMQSRLARAVGDPSGFGERLVQFWSDHFTIRAGGYLHSALTAVHVEETIRPNLGGRFADMMFAAETHPAMVLYLEQNLSVGPRSPWALRKPGRRMGLNENLAREMIELHSLGVGADYTQKDVRELAELLTGLTYQRDGDGPFLPMQAEPGAETVLGKSYGGGKNPKLDDIRAVIHDLATHEATATHIARKLAVHFVSDNPPQSLVERLATAFRDSHGDLSVVNATLVEAPEILSHFREKIRQPYDFIVSGIRALGLTDRLVMELRGGQLIRGLLTPLEYMGQPWNAPRGPDGWPEAAENWATPPGLAARMNWAFGAPAEFLRVLPDPREFISTALGGTASDALKWAVPKAESRREGVALILASSDFNRR